MNKNLFRLFNYERWRYWFFDTFGERTSIKYYLRDGDFDEVNGWEFRGRFYPCEQKDEMYTP